MTPLSVGDICLRLGLAFVAGFLVGWERESHGRPAGLRTNILACVASAAAMMIAHDLLTQVAGSAAAGAVRADPARLGAGILTGIGFLGAGTILRHENLVRGVTTAASLWFVTVLGLALGTGLFVLGGVGTVLALFALYILPRLERKARRDWYVELTVTMRLDGPNEKVVKETIESKGPAVQSMKLGYDLEKQQKTVICDLKLKHADRFALSNEVVTALTKAPGVLQVAWE
jgi:putative Mg2+ transporter-C (MgtC) family protein